MKWEPKKTKTALLGGAVLYARVSTGRQAEKDLSMPDQFLKMRGYCDANGLKNIREFGDAQTGTNFDRPGLLEMMEFIRSNPDEITVLLVHSFSRLGRDSAEFELFRRKLTKLGVELISITQDVGDADGGGILRKVINLMDEQFSLETSKHVIRSMGENARQGFWNGGNTPFGYRAIEAGQRGQTVKKKLAIHPAEAEDVRLIYSLYLDGDGQSGSMGIKRIACYLNENGLLRRNGAKWTTGQVHLVLHDTVYIGEFIFGKGKVAKDQIIVEVPSIIDTTQFQQVQQRLKRNNPRKTAPRIVNSPVLLTGLATCAKCGSGMILRTGKSGRYRYYTCGAQVRKGKSVCEGQSLPMAELDELVTSVASDAVVNPDHCASVLKELAERSDTRDFDERNRSDALMREQSDADGAVSRLYRMIESGMVDLDDPEFVARFKKVKDERDIIKAKFTRLAGQRNARLNVSPNQIARFSKLLGVMIGSGPIAFRKSYLRAFINEVRVDGETIEIIPHGEAA